jgi:hypothetical protein
MKVLIVRYRSVLDPEAIVVVNDEADAETFLERIRAVDPENYFEVNTYTADTANAAVEYVAGEAAALLKEEG